MRTLTRHEKKLTFLLVGALAVGVHLILLKVALELDRSNRRKLAQVDEELTEARFGSISGRIGGPKPSGWKRISSLCRRKIRLRPCKKCCKTRPPRPG